MRSTVMALFLLTLCTEANSQDSTTRSIKLERIPSLDQTEKYSKPQNPVDIIKGAENTPEKPCPYCLPPAHIPTSPRHNTGDVTAENKTLSNLQTEAIQNLKERIESLEQRVSTLENKGENQE